ncbi:UNVERIFIED_ORG: hypothetical protein J2Y81_003430 [Paraburkholderia sediminicola]|jgi:hypothetical protein|uniref:hypothetical protein n=1 Tax=Paraburkholderia TaxID=1822464 RepID=UPI00211227B9|nr:MULTISPECIES: hypothetical protein [Paraburkholderia]MCP2087413.1 hypothetical protein [Paraburkholderia sediminicola]MCX4143226.1 hypothetical protein [Paraburkholderia aspalathi]MDN7175900.1 hypothetical protein [Paraburkholderia sp. SEWSISQ10-3 4]MDQ6505541.1 hypothetical protein [Paraburkholderia aspalathi]
MQLTSDIDSINLLDETVRDYYAKSGNRSAIRFLHRKGGEGDNFFTHFLIDRKHVICYEIGTDRGMWLGAVSLAIGPHYFGPADFWSYEASERFKMDASTDAVIHNLALLDEFFGYPDALKHAYGYKP